MVLLLFTSCREGVFSETRPLTALMFAAIVTIRANQESLPGEGMEVRWPWLGR